MIKTLLAVAAVLVFSVCTFAQEKCDHSSSAKERFDHIRILPPVKILSYDGLTVEYSHEDRLGLHLGSVKISTDTKLPADFGKRYKGGPWWILYCLKDNHAYSVHELAAEQKKSLK